MNQWSIDDRELAQLNAKSLNYFFCALKSEDYMRVSTYSTGKKIWDRLCLTYEGTNEVKETRINTLLSDYELIHENRRCIGHAKRHNQKLVVAVTRAKRRLRHILCLHPQLMISRSERLMYLVILLKKLVE